jgi:hypothetical protein
MSTLEQLARQFAASQPTRDGGSWAGWCASMEFRFNAASVAYSNATLAGNATNIVSSDPSAAPIGVLHYWGGGDGHVATEVGGRGKKLFMASSQVTEDLGVDIGFISFSQYKLGGYRGWGYTYGVNKAIVGSDTGQYGDGGGSGGGGTPGKIGNTNNSPVYQSGSNFEFWVPGSGTQKDVQQGLANRGRYSGPIDGAWGTASVKGIQETIQNVGYTGPIDGVAGERTAHYVQVYAQKFGGYKGPIDSFLGQKSWDGFAYGLLHD